MARNSYSCLLLVLGLAGLVGCSSTTSNKEAAKARTAPDKIQGKAQIVLAEATAMDAALNAGGQSVYIWEGARRYRLFLKTKVEFEPGKEYVVEGVNAQRVIDEIGDPAEGKNGYPLAASCDRVVRLAWSGLPFDVADGHASALRTRVKRYPARTVFLVTKIEPAPAKEGEASKETASDEDGPEITVPAEKQRTLLAEGPVVQPAPLWEPAGGTVSCKVILNKDGKIAELETGTQLCEIVPWSKFRYQPTVQKGKPVRVKTEVEIRFEPRKALPT